MPNGHGGIVDDILVYRVDAETYMLCGQRRQYRKGLEAHLRSRAEAFGMEAGHGKELYNASDEICPAGRTGALWRCRSSSGSARMPMSSTSNTTPSSKTEGRRASETPSCRPPATPDRADCEIYAANEDADRLWTALWEAGVRSTG